MELELRLRDVANFIEGSGDYPEVLAFWKCLLEKLLASPSRLASFGFGEGVDSLLTQVNVQALFCEITRAKDAEAWLRAHWIAIDPADDFVRTLLKDDGQCAADLHPFLQTLSHAV